MSNDSQNPNDKATNARRNFLKVSGVGILGAVIGARILTESVTALAQGAAAKPGAAPDMVKESDPQATALGYHVDAKKVDVKKFAKRAGPEGAKQFCYNCQFYQAKGDAKATASAPCTIFANKGVASKGWCNSWTQNPAVKG